jgi:hypothetical protein
MALPGGIPTHFHNVTKKWSRLNQVFISDHSTDLIVSCDTETRFRSTKTDHLPVVTTLNLAVPVTQASAIPNFREVNWVEFRENLSDRLAHLDEPHPIRNQVQLDTSCDMLTRTLQATISDCVPVAEICSKLKRWWTKELTQLRREMNLIGRRLYKLRNIPMHPVHEEHREAVKRYDSTTEKTKNQHWRDWLEQAVDPDIWTVHKYTSAPSTDGAKHASWSSSTKLKVQR